MSGVGGLFADAKTDSKLEGLFAAKNAGPVKRTIGERTVVNVNVKKLRRKKAVDESVKGDKSGTSERDDSSDDSQEEEREEEEEEEDEEPKPKKKKRSKDDDEDEDLENKYFEKILEGGEEEEEEESRENEEESQDSDSEDEHSTKEEKNASKAKTIDFKENETEKAERTIFVGNLASAVIINKKEYKAFKKRFLEFGEIDSIRFRSIAFAEALPRKVAFVQQKLHSSRDSVNAYIVFKNKADAMKSLNANGEVFSNLHLRVDSVSHPSKIDNNRAIFVGNMDFDEKEEELWSIFKECGDIEFVRIVRDSKTNVGKGFGYVQFKDFTGVSRALLLNEKKLGEKKRKLRISRSKRMKKPAEKESRGNQRNTANLSEAQRTKLGRAKRVLGKADRATAGQHVVEGVRAKKGDGASGIKNGKNRVKKPRIRQRSTEFKNARNAKKN